jgi:pimeloyl-ACP methyl ester carboxylesterase
LMRKLMVTALALACAATLWASFASPDHATSGAAVSGVTLTPCHVDGVKEEVRCGVYNVFENRRARTGRKLPLKIVVIPARQPQPDQGPIFYMAGGPGETATELAGFVIDQGDADEHDIVLVDERGTGDRHRLDCKSPRSDENLEGYLNGPFDPATAHACRDELAKKYDLSQYTTPNFADDIDEVRAAMGYDKININAGSFGTYAAQIYMRRHRERVRSAYLTSLVPLSNRVPLYHAQGAQWALDQLFRECDEDVACHAAYPRFREDFAAVLNLVRKKPVATWVKHPVSGARAEIRLTERGFADAPSDDVPQPKGERSAAPGRTSACRRLQPVRGSSSAGQPRDLYRFQNGTALLYYVQRVRRTHTCRRRRAGDARKLSRLLASQRPDGSLRKLAEDGPACRLLRTLLFGSPGGAGLR